MLQSNLVQMLNNNENNIGFNNHNKIIHFEMTVKLLWHLSTNRRK